MPEIDPGDTFRELPLTAEHDAEVRHYIKKRKQSGQAWDTLELKLMLKDMQEPPIDDEPEPGATADETEECAERAAASIDEEMDPIEASEERKAAMEAELMKGP